LTLFLRHRIFVATRSKLLLVQAMQQFVAVNAAVSNTNQAAQFVEDWVVAAGLAPATAAGANFGVK